MSEDAIVAKSSEDDVVITSADPRVEAKNVASSFYTVFVNRRYSQRNNENDSGDSSDISLQEISTTRVIDSVSRGEKRKIKESTSEKSVLSKKLKTESLSCSSRKRHGFELIGGMKSALEKIGVLLFHFCHPHVGETLGITPPRGLLLHGPSGCGKTLLAHAIAEEINVPLVKSNTSELMAGYPYGIEQRIKDIFEEAANLSPSVVFIKFDDFSHCQQIKLKIIEKRIAAQILNSIEELNLSDDNNKILFIAATTNLESVDPFLRKIAVLDSEITLNVPSKSSRTSILQIQTDNLKLSENVDIDYIAVNTPGCVGADLAAITRQAIISAINKHLKKSRKINDGFTNENIQNSTGGPGEANGDSEIQNQQSSKSSDGIRMCDLDEILLWVHDMYSLTKEDFQEITVEMEDFETALKTARLSVKRKLFTPLSKLTWDDVGAMKDIKKELQISIVFPIKNADKFETLGLDRPAAVLLCGPPGCGKTFVANAVANEAGINFISVKGPELLSTNLEESERNIRQCFERARLGSPCLMFFDDIDTFCPKACGKGVAALRVLHLLLAKFDDVRERKGIFILAATNRPDLIDPALIRPGRFDKILYVGFPNTEERTDILRVLTKNGKAPKLTPKDLEVISFASSGYTGADLAALVREAGSLALNESICNKNDGIVSLKHLEKAFNKIRPSTLKKEREYYEKLKKMYSAIENS